ncbi:hypothetical protein GGS21DRAFT_515769 [Xylaria nigripes]|nr:hypothetical protein GGS21DRAFT_515769 [Xylaria nigripes]
MPQDARCAEEKLCSRLQMRSSHNCPLTTPSWLSICFFLGFNIPPAIRPLIVVQSPLGNSGSLPFLHGGGHGAHSPCLLLHSDGQAGHHLNELPLAIGQLADGSSSALFGDDPSLLRLGYVVFARRRHGCRLLALNILRREPSVVVLRRLYVSGYVPLQRINGMKIGVVLEELRKPHAIPIQRRGCFGAINIPLGTSLARLFG